MEHPEIVFDQDGQAHSFIPTTLNALVAVGLIWREGDRWVYNTTRLDLAHWPELAVCDFCGTQPVTWTINAETFRWTIGAAGGVSTGGWAACEVCGAAVEAGDKEALAERSCRMLAIGAPDWFVPSLHQTQRAYLVLFWQHYKGISRFGNPYGDAP